jgi:hypothetical protein
MKEVYNEVAKNLELLSIYYLYGNPELNWAIINGKMYSKENPSWKVYRCPYFDFTNEAGTL